LALKFFDSYHAFYEEGFILSHSGYFRIYSTVLIVVTHNRKHFVSRFR